MGRRLGSILPEGQTQRSQLVQVRHLHHELWQVCISLCMSTRHILILHNLYSLILHPYTYSHQQDDLDIINLWDRLALQADSFKSIASRNISIVFKTQNPKPR